MQKAQQAKKVIGTISSTATGRQEFKVAKHTLDKNSKAGTTMEIALALSDASDTVIEILSTEGLPAEYEPGRPIIWINNFGIRSKSTNAYKDQDYTVFLPPHPEGHGTFIYMLNGTLYTDRKPALDSNGRLAVTLSWGDPPIGWTKP